MTRPTIGARGGTGTSRSPDDAVLPLTRHVAFHIVVVLGVAFVLLFFFPGRTDRLWAWTIRPDMTPLLMGSGYLAGAYFFLRVLRATAWHTVSAGFLPVSVFATLMTLATVLHWDRFAHGHPIFWVWLLLYAVTPVLVPVVWWRNQRRDPGHGASHVVLPAPVRWAFGALGVVELAAVLVVFTVPTLLVDAWPWTLSPLTARIVAGWFSLTGTFAIIMALDGRWSAIKVTLQAALIGLALILVSTWRAWHDFDPGNPLRWGFVGFVALLLVAFAGLLLHMRRRDGAPASVARASEG